MKKNLSVFTCLFVIVMTGYTGYAQKNSNVKRSVGERLKYASHYSYNGSSYDLEDTIVYGYKNSNMEKYDTMIRYINDGGGGLEPDTKEINVYTQDMKYNISQTEQKWDFGTSAWRTDKTIVSTYADSNLTQEITQVYDINTNTLVNSKKVINVYNPDGKRASESIYKWNAGNSSWVISNDYNYTYTGKSMTQYVSESKDMNGNLTFRQRSSFTYNGTHVSEGTTEHWDIANSKYINFYKYILQFSGDNVTQEVDQNWDKNTSAWVNTDLYAYQYNGSNNTEILVQSWGGSAWVNSTRTTMQYSGTNETDNVFESWNTNTNAWDKVSRDQNAYANNHHQFHIYQEWGTSDWLNSSKEIYGYNANGSLISVTPFEWDASASVWKPEEFGAKQLYYYEYYTLAGVNSISHINQLVLFPNPVGELFYLKINSDDEYNANILIFDVTGKKVMDSDQLLIAGENTVSIDSTKLSQGIYNIEIYKEGKLIGVRKIVK